jgi:uncharacterized membrane protein YjdF
MLKILNKLSTLLMFFFTIILAFINISNGHYSRIFSYISILIVVLIPLLLKNTRFKLEEKDKLILNIFIFIADFLGCIVNLYNKIWWFDIFAHYLSGIFTFMAALFILKRLNKYNPKDILFNLLFIFGIVFLCAGLWEIGEFTSDYFLKTNLQHNLDTGVYDTMEDILVAFFGGITALIFYLINLKKKVKR